MLRGKKRGGQYLVLAIDPAWLPPGRRTSPGVRDDLEQPSATTRPSPWARTSPAAETSRRRRARSLLGGHHPQIHAVEQHRAGRGRAGDRHWGRATVAYSLHRASPARRPSCGGCDSIPHPRAAVRRRHLAAGAGQRASRPGCGHEPTDGPGRKPPGRRSRRRASAALDRTASRRRPRQRRPDPVPRQHQPGGADGRGVRLAARRLDPQRRGAGRRRRARHGDVLLRACACSTTDGLAAGQGLSEQQHQPQRLACRCWRDCGRRPAAPARRRPAPRRPPPSRPTSFRCPAGSSRSLRGGGHQRACGCLRWRPAVAPDVEADAKLALLSKELPAQDRAVTGVDRRLGPQTGGVGLFPERDGRHEHLRRERLIGPSAARRRYGVAAGRGMTSCQT